MTTQHRIAVLGGGSFGTAIANIMATNGYDTQLWMRNPERAARCAGIRENPEYLPGYKLSDNIHPTADLVEAVTDSDLVFLSIPSKSFREVAQMVSPHIKAGTIVVSTTKGIEPSHFTLMSEILEQEISQARVGVLSGPNFAKEIVQQQYTGTVIASSDTGLCETVQKTLHSPYFRVYSNADRFAVELAGTLKNAYAVVCGMATAMGCGHNTLSMLITRSLAEMGRFAHQLGGNPLTFLGLAGVGDLILTCTSPLSRNYRLGYALGEGKGLQETLEEIGQTVEGVNTVRLVKSKADELEIYMPLVSGLHSVMFEGLTIAEVVSKLMLGEQTTDVEYIISDLHQ